MTFPAPHHSGGNGAVNPPPAVFVVDDDPDVLRAMTRLLRSAGLAVEAFGSAPQFLDRITPERPGCVVLDFKMPDVNGLELQAELARRGIALPIVFVTGHGDIPIAVQALKHGAVDFLTKPYRADELLRAVAVALQHDAARRRAAQERDELQRRYAILTPRERDVLGLVVRGLLNKQIAATLGNSERTVKVHRARVMAKMQAGSVAELTRMVERNGLGAEATASAPARD